MSSLLNLDYDLRIENKLITELWCGLKYHFVRYFEEFDFIYAMDSNNLKNILAHAKHVSHAQKAALFLSNIYNEPGMEVPDPYYGGEQEFEDVFQLVYKACEDLSVRFR